MVWFKLWIVRMPASDTVFNCLEEGHRWRDHKKTPLLQELQEILDREALNRVGGTGNKGGHTPMNTRNGKGKAATPNKPAQ